MGRKAGCTVNATLFRRADGHYVKLYLGDTVYDEAGPFDEREDAELMAWRATEPYGYVGSYGNVAHFDGDTFLPESR